jgi:hypothetical protein
VNEFKAYTLPKLRLKRFIKMQALMRGHYVRRFKIPRLKERLRMYNLIAESFLRSAINVHHIATDIGSYHPGHRDGSDSEQQVQLGLVTLLGQASGVSALH